MGRGMGARGEERGQTTAGNFNSQEKLKTMLMENFEATIKKHYGMLWYFLEWPICRLPAA